MADLKVLARGLVKAERELFELGKRETALMARATDLRRQLRAEGVTVERMPHDGDNFTRPRFYRLSQVEPDA